MCLERACYFSSNLGLDLYCYDPYTHLLIEWRISNPCYRCLFTNQTFSDTNPYYYLSKNSEATFDAGNNKTAHDLCERADLIANNSVDHEFAFL